MGGWESTTTGDNNYGQTSLESNMRRREEVIGQKTRSMSYGDEGQGVVAGRVTGFTSHLSSERPQL